jgi:hypothetical protein
MKFKFVILASVLVMLLNSISNGQSEKGNISIGGQTNFSFHSITTSLKTSGVSSNYEKSKSFAFSPKLGYFFLKNLQAGIMIPLAFSRSSGITYDNDYKTFSFQLIPLVQKYFGNNKVRPFIFIAAGLGWGNSINSSQSDPDTYKTRYKLYTLKSGGGVSFFFNDMISIDCSLGYSYDSDSVDSPSVGTTSYDHSVIQKGFNSEFGINFYLK